MEESAASPPRGRIGRTVATILLFAAGAAVPYLVPSLSRYRFGGEEVFRRILSGTPRVRLFERREAEPREVRKESPGPVEAPPRAGEIEGPPKPRVARRASSPELLPSGEAVSIDDDEGVLVPFFEKLQRTERGEPGAITRISHFGDSPVTGDLISGEARARLQKDFGDAGHGFVLAASPWGWYGHNGVTLKASGWKPLSPVLTSGDGGHHGLGIVSFVGRGGAKSEVEVAGGGFTRLEVSYLERPGGGRFTIATDDGPEAEVDTKGTERKDAFFTLALPAGARKVTLRPKGEGTVSVYGFVLELSLIHI